MMRGVGACAELQSAELNGKQEGLGQSKPVLPPQRSAVQGLVPWCLNSNATGFAWEGRSGSPPARIPANTLGICLPGRVGASKSNCDSAAAVGEACESCFQRSRVPCGMARLVLDPGTCNDSTQTVRTQQSFHPRCRASSQPCPAIPGWVHLSRFLHGSGLCPIRK
ncbi:hypothetical protein GALL_241300 [mine drainage metagenome]|uniref:Uncharacterized protein n=1 Tax=mine drainage metagenome TaxID=410659 RepID=A0A1J5RCX3_9ZZZZ